MLIRYNTTEFVVIYYDVGVIERVCDPITHMT